MTSFFWLATSDPTAGQAPDLVVGGARGMARHRGRVAAYPKRPLPGSMDLRRETAERPGENMCASISPPATHRISLALR